MSPFHIQKILFGESGKDTFWRKWGYLEGAMSQVGETAVMEYEMDNFQSDFIFRINMKSESEYERKPVSTEL